MTTPHLKRVSKIQLKQKRRFYKGLLKGSGSGVALNFIKSFADNFIISNIEHANASYLYDIPVANGEMSIYSHVGASIAQLTDMHLSEHPIKTPAKGAAKKRKIDNHRRFDHWCFYGTNTNIAMEFKLHKFSLYPDLSKNLTKGIINKWFTMCTQTDQAFDYMQSKEWGGPRGNRVSIGIMAFYAQSCNENTYKFKTTDERNSLFNKLCDYFKLLSIYAFRNGKKSINYP